MCISGCVRGGECGADGEGKVWEEGQSQKAFGDRNGEEVGGRRKGMLDEKKRGDRKYWMDVRIGKERGVG